MSYRGPSGVYSIILSISSMKMIDNDDLYESTKAF